MNYTHGMPSRRGPEADLVLRFIDESLPVPPKGLTRSIFIEPDLGCSVPDIVVVFWDPKIARKWPITRRLLRNIDYKLIHHLYCKGCETEENLKRYFPRELPQILDKLFEAAITMESNFSWKLKPFEEIFAVKQIITFEAKITASIHVMEQAFINSTFSSESYVVTKTKSPSGQALSYAEKFGVGLWSFANSEYISLREAQERPLPQSYLSWLINEMAWEYSFWGDNEHKC